MKYSSLLSLSNLVQDARMLVVQRDEFVRNVAHKMLDYDTSAAVVLDHWGRLDGIITEHDIVHKAISVNRNVDETTAASVMTRDTVSVPVESSFQYALAVMGTKNVRHLPVTRDGKVIGVLDVRDLYGAMNEALNKQLEDNQNMLAYAYGAPYSFVGSNTRN